MPTFTPDTLHAILIIVACIIGLFAGIWLFGYFFSSGSDTDESFREAAEYRGEYSWGGIRIYGLLALSVLIGVLAYHGLAALAEYLLEKK